MKFNCEKHGLVEGCYFDSILLRSLKCTKCLLEEKEAQKKAENNKKKTEKKEND